MPSTSKIMPTKPGDGFIYSGNPHESVPRALFLDQNLTPLERNAWQVIRMMLREDGVTAFPTYEELRPYLTSMPYANKASCETVSRALTLLRLTRWLSLYQRRRGKNGCVQSNLYILHDTPVSIYEAIQLDAEYLSLVCSAITHASKAIRCVGLALLHKITTEVDLKDKRLPTRLEVLLERVEHQLQENTIQHLASDKLSTRGQSHKSEASDLDLLRNQKGQISESEAGLNTSETQVLPNPKSGVRSSIINIILRTYPNLILPERFEKLPVSKQEGTLKLMQQLDEHMQQQVLNEWDKRCEQQQIRKPAAYLFGMIQKAYKGEFNAWLEDSSQAVAMPKITNDTQAAKFAHHQEKLLKEKNLEEEIIDKEAFLKHIAHLKEIVKQGSLRGRD